MGSQVKVFIDAGTEEIRKIKMEANVEKGGDSDDLGAPEGFNGSCKELPGICKDLLTNMVFIFSIVAAIGDILIVVGFTVFGPKYVENQFSVSAALAAGIFGKQLWVKSSGTSPKDHLSIKTTFFSVPNVTFTCKITSLLRPPQN